MSIQLINPRLAGNISHLAVGTATTVAGNLSSSFSAGQNISGVSLTENMRILIKNQTNAVENGIYVVQTELPPYRDEDMPEGLDTSSATIPIMAGNYSGTIWIVIGPGMVGTDPLQFQRCDIGAVLETNRGGTGTTTLGGNNTLLYTSAQNNITATNTLANAILATNGSSQPVLSTTTPSGLIVPSATLSLCKISDGGNFGYILSGSTLAADRTINFPTTTVSQNIVLDDLQQTISNKTLIGSTFSDGSGLKKLALDTNQVTSGSTVILLAPTAGGTIATVEYISGGAGVANWRAPVRAVTTELIAMVASGSGVGKTLTSAVSADIATLQSSFDGVTLNLNDRILVTYIMLGGISPSLGIYTITDMGSVATSFVLTRSTDADTSAKMPPGTTVYVTEGTINAASQWSLTTYTPIILDTTAINFQRVNALSNLTFGNGFTQSGNLISVGASDTIGTNQTAIFVNSSAVTGQPLISSGTPGSAATFGAINLAESAVTGILPLIAGGTGRSSYTNNAVIYGNMQQTNSAANAVLVTNGSSIPNFSTTLPSGLIFSGPIRLNSGSHNYSIAAGTATAACSATLPNGEYNDIFVMQSLEQTLTNKTLIAPKISGSLYDNNGAQALAIIAGGAEHLTVNAGTLGSSNHITINPTGEFYAAKPLRLTAGSFSVGLAAPNSLSSNITLTLPNTAGNSGQCLVSNGAGVLSFADRLITDTLIVTMLTGFAAASSINYTSVAWLTWTATTATDASLAFTILEVGLGGNARSISVQLFTDTGTILANYSGIAAAGQYTVVFTPPVSMALLILQVKKNQNAGANPTIAGAVINISK